MMQKTALFPGSFDPITKGHIDALEKVIPIFDKVYVALGINTSKQYYFTIEERLSMLKATFESYPKVEVISYQGLTVKFCEKMAIPYIIRGLRNTIDFEYEKAINEMNHKLNPDVHTFFVTTSPDYASISSTIVREIIKSGGKVDDFVPQSVVDNLKK